jgi:L-threonylcarbamoyladenylate synthase
MNLENTRSSASIAISPAAPESVREAARRLREGGLVAFATETVYGLGANALDERAVARIFAAKGRPATNPLIVHAADEASARQVVSEWPREAALLAQAFWPGPLTLVLPRTDNVPSIITAGLESVGVRVPAHPVALALLREAGVPVAAPSANRSEEVSPTRAEHVRQSLGKYLDATRDMILDGGACQVGIESSVLDLTQSPPVLLRPGGITRAQIESVVGPIRVLEAHSANAPENNKPRPSPGMMARHYAPKARAVRFDSRLELEGSLGRCKHLHTLGVLLMGDFERARWPQVLAAMTLAPDAQAYASQIYEALHQMDEAGCTEIWVEMPPEREEWRAVRDRLQRATVPSST